MLMNLKILSRIKSKLKKYIKDKEVLDLILFGSAVKGKATPDDIDIAIITNKKIETKNEDFHISVIKPEEFFINPPSLISTLLREGYSLKNNKSFSEAYKFESRVMFIYNLSYLNNSEKVRAVNFLRGKGKGIVEQKKGVWLSRNVFLIQLGNENIFEKFFINQKIKYKKYYILIH